MTHQPETPFPNDKSTLLNPRWLAFCKASGIEPTTKCRLAEAGPLAGKHVGAEFVCWNRARWREFNALHGRQEGDPLTEAVQDAYDEFLERLPLLHP